VESAECSPKVCSWWWVFCTYTNFVLLFPVAYFVDCYCGTSISLYYFFIQTAMSTLVAGREACKWIGKILIAG
jgi:hypothetical protein